MTGYVKRKPGARQPLAAKSLQHGRSAMPEEAGSWSDAEGRRELRELGDGCVQLTSMGTRRTTIPMCYAQNGRCLARLCYI